MTTGSYQYLSHLCKEKTTREGGGGGDRVTQRPYTRGGPRPVGDGPRGGRKRGNAAVVSKKSQLVGFLVTVETQKAP